jgi:hypothetical protein
MNTIRLKLFSFSLKDKVKTLLQNLRSGSIRVWDEMQQQFLKFFPSHKTNSFKKQITTFTQKPGETIYQCWDRYKDLHNTSPHHGFEIWRLVSQFYEGLAPKDKQMMELMCNGTFKDKDPDEAMEYLDLLAEMLKIRTLQALMRHQVKLNLIHLVETCTTLGKIMTSKPNLRL